MAPGDKPRIGWRGGLILYYYGLGQVLSQPRIGWSAGWFFMAPGDKPRIGWGWFFMAPGDKPRIGWGWYDISRRQAGDRLGVVLYGTKRSL